MIDVSSFGFPHKVTCGEQEDEIEQVNYLTEGQEALSGQIYYLCPRGRGLWPEPGGVPYWLQERAFWELCLWAPALRFWPPVKKKSP